MSRVLHKLTPKKVAASKGSGRLSDGGGLYLSISNDGRKRWVFLFTIRGRQREMGLGGAGPAGVSLAEARKGAASARELVRQGKDPIESKRELEERAPDRVIPDFGSFADEYVAKMEPSWTNAKHVQQWKNTLKDHAAALRPKMIDKIDTEDVLGVLQPLWLKIPETAQRLRGRIETVLDAAKSKGLRKGENPARWRGHLAHLLPKRRKLTRGHLRALPYEQMPVFMQALRKETGEIARLLEFTILTAARSMESRGCVWPEIDTAKQVWTVPPERMKAKREHRVPLSAPAQDLLQRMEAIREGALVFEGQKPNRPFSDMAMTQLLKRMGYSNVATAHGFRSSFRDWASECTSFSNEACEAALAHVIPNKAEAAYRRGDLLEQRRKLMQAWANYCDGGAEILAIAKVAS